MLMVGIPCLGQNCEPPSNMPMPPTLLPHSADSFKCLVIPLYNLEVLSMPSSKELSSVSVFFFF